MSLPSHFPVTPSLDAELHFAHRQMETIRARMARTIHDRAAARRALFNLAAFRAALPERLKVRIVTPCDDGHKVCFWESLRLFEKTPDPAGHVYEARTPPGDSLIPRARNNHTHLFRVDTAADYLGWIDSDIDFRPDDVFRLIAHRLPIVAGTYYIKDREGRPCINTIPGETVDPATGLQKVATAGTGFLFIHRSVIEEMIAAADWWPHWRITYTDDNHKDTRHHLFHHGVIHDPEMPHTPRDLSEDWSFCYFARQLGYDIWLDTRAAVLHRGEIDYPLHARRLTADEAARGEIAQPDGTFTAMAKPEKV